MTRKMRAISVVFLVLLIVAAFCLAACDGQEPALPKLTGVMRKTKRVRLVKIIKLYELYGILKSQ